MAVVATKSNGSVPQVIKRDLIVALTIAVWAIAGSLLLTREPGLIAVAGSFAIGWSHLVGRCGLSHLGALTPRGKLPNQRSRWLVNVLVYLAAGAVASISVGATLATLGSLVVPPRLRGVAVALVLAVALVASASELRLIPWRLPEPKWQTRREWGLLPPPAPAVLWGFGLGLTFATVFTFSGTWLVLLLPIALGEPTVGALMLVAHWLGRATPILAGPLLLDHASNTLKLLAQIEGKSGLFRTSNIIGIGLIALALAIMLTDTVA